MSTQYSAADLKERNQKVIDALYKAHGLSRALDFMTEASPEGHLGVSTFVNSVEEVNNAVYEAIQVALEGAELLQNEFSNGGAA